MTCIASYRAPDGSIWMGGDSAAAPADYSIVLVSRETKVFRYGEMAVGIAGDIRPGQILRFGIKPPALAKGIDPMTFLVLDFIPSLQRAMEAHNASLDFTGGFLVGLRGRVFEIDDDWGITEPSERFYAIGSAAPYALGAYFGMDPAGMTPSAVLSRALSAAAFYSPGAVAPFSFVSLDPLQ